MGGQVPRLAAHLKRLAACLLLLLSGLAQARFDYWQREQRMACPINADERVRLRDKLLPVTYLDDDWALNALGR
jgi:hypothetical protein